MTFVIRIFGVFKFFFNVGIILCMRAHVLTIDTIEINCFDSIGYDLYVLTG